MRLVIVRHGIAVSRDDPACPPDEERPLTDKGRRRTRAAAKGLAVLLDEAPGAYLTSPLVRAVQTAEIVREVIGGSGAPALRETDALRFDRDPMELFGEAAGLDASTVVCAGHAPHVDVAIARALGARRTVVTRLKKAAAACLDMTDPTSGRGHLDWLVQPRPLRRLGRRA